jgi:hypothetical protein
VGGRGAFSYVALIQEQKNTNVDDKNIREGWNIPTRQEYFMIVNCKERELHEYMRI